MEDLSAASPGETEIGCTAAARVQVQRRCSHRSVTACQVDWTR